MKLKNFLVNNGIKITTSSWEAPLQFDWSFSPARTPQSNNKAESMVENYDDRDKKHNRSRIESDRQNGATKSSAQSDNKTKFSIERHFT